MDRILIALALLAMAGVAAAQMPVPIVFGGLGGGSGPVAGNIQFAVPGGFYLNQNVNAQYAVPGGIYFND